MKISAAIKSVVQAFGLGDKSPGDSPDSPKATKADQALKDRLDDMVEAMKADIKDWNPVYRDGVNYVFGNQLAGQDIKDGWPRIQADEIFPATIQEQSLLSQRRVAIKSLPFEDSDKDGAALWQPVLQWQYEQGINLPNKTILGIIDGKTHGWWILRLWWDERAEWDKQKRKWIGALKSELVRPEFVYVNAGDDPDDAEEIIYWQPIRMDEAQRLYPDFKKQLEKATSEPPDQVMRDLATFGQNADTGPTTDEVGTGPEDDWEGRLARLLAPQFPGEGTYTREGPARPIWLCHFFFRDRKTEKQTIVDRVPTGSELVAEGKALEENEINGIGLSSPQHRDVATGELLTDETWPNDEREDVDVPLYPTYRNVVRIAGTDTVVHDEAWPLRLAPYAIGKNMPLPHTPHGMNAVEMTRRQQDFVNRLWRHLGAYVDLFADPSVDVEEGAIENDADPEEELVASPGKINHLAAGAINGNKIRRNSPPAMGPTLFQILQLSVGKLQDMTGVHDIGLGKQGEGMTATEAINLETNTKLRTALQWLLCEAFILRTMTRVQEFCAFYMREGDMVRISGPGTARVATLSGQQFDARFDLKLAVATDLPFDRDRRKADAQVLFKELGVAYLEPLLEAFDVADKDKILGRVKAHQMILAAQAIEDQKQAQMAEQWKTQQKNPVTGEPNAPPRMDQEQPAAVAPEQPPVAPVPTPG